MDLRFLDVLHADGPAADWAEKMALYGQFIGSWDTDIVTHEQNAVEHRGNGEIISAGCWRAGRSRTSG